MEFCVGEVVVGDMVEVVGGDMVDVGDMDEVVEGDMVEVGDMDEVVGGDMDEVVGGDLVEVGDMVELVVVDEVADIIAMLVIASLFSAVCIGDVDGSFIVSTNDEFIVKTDGSFITSFDIVILFIDVLDIFF